MCRMEEPNAASMGHCVWKSNARSGVVFEGPPVSVLNCVKILVAQVRDLHSTIDSLEKKASSTSNGLQHILKIMSSSEGDSCTEVDNFWYFFCCEPTVLRKLNDIVQDTSDELSDEISDLDFWECSSWDSGEIDGLLTEQMAQLDPALGLASQSPVVSCEGSDAMLKHRAQVSLSPATTVGAAIEDHDSTRLRSELCRKSSGRSVEDLAKVMRQRREACTEFESLPDGSTAEVVALQPQAKLHSWMEQKGKCEASTRAGQIWKKSIKAV